MSKIKYDIYKNGFEVIRIDNVIRNQIVECIKKDLCSKLQINKKTSFFKIQKNILNLSDEKYNKKFGVSCFRYLSFNVAKYVNRYIQKYKLGFKVKNAFLHYCSDNDLKLNNKLKKNQFCIIYRIVRKNKSDVSFVHRDSDFWKIHKSDKRVAPKIPYKFTKRIKVWLPVYGCDSQNSLNFYNKSHKHNIRSNFKKVKNYYKPEIDKSYISRYKKNIIMPLNNFKRDVIIFDDNCVHFAPKNLSTNLRISCEFTVMINE